MHLTTLLRHLSTHPEDVSALPKGSSRQSYRVPADLAARLVDVDAPLVVGYVHATHKANLSHRRFHRETQLLDALAASDDVAQRMRVSRFNACLGDPDVGPIFTIREYLPGQPLTLAHPDELERAALALTAIHDTPVEPCREALTPPKPPHITTRWLDTSARDPLLARARDAALQLRPAPGHLDETLTHGDPFGRHMLWGEDTRPAIIDWERATLAHPASDLALLLRGKRQPFGLPEGRARLVEAYNRMARRHLALETLLFFECALLGSRVHAHLQDAENTRALSRARRRLERFLDTIL